MRFQFSDFELDEGRFELTRAGVPITVEPKGFRMLMLLLQRHPDTVSKHELLATLWPDVTVTLGALRQTARSLRRGLEESSIDGMVLRTVRGRGYRIGVDVERVEADERDEPGAGGTVDRDAFVGRSSLLASCRDALDDVEKEVGRIVLLFGEPGIGKTRTAEEIADWAQHRGFEVLWGRCVEGEGAPALWPWVQILRHALRSRDAQEIKLALGRGAADIAVLVPEFVERMPAPEDSAAPDLDAARFRLFDSIAQFFKRASESRSIALIVDDLHQADSASLRLLAHVAGELRSRRVLIVGSYRDVAAPPNETLDEVVVGLERLSGRDVVYPLRGLAGDEVESLVASRRGTVPSKSEVQRIREQTGGNPYFVCELSRWMVSDDALRDAIPRSVRAMIRQRLGQLGDETREMIEIAAIIGRNGSIPLLARVLGDSDFELLDEVEEAERAGLLRTPRGESQTYRFTHALVQETVYSLQPRSQRATLHRAVAETIERFYSEALDAHLPSLAYHYSRALGTGTAAKAIGYGIRAGERAARQLAYEDAIEHYGRVARILDEHMPTELTRQCEVLLAIARLEDWAGDRDAQIEACLRAAEIARRLGRGDLLTDAALVFAERGPVFGRTDTTAVSLLEESLDRVDLDDLPKRARLLTTLAGEIAFKDHGRRKELQNQACGIAIELEDDRLLFEVSGEEGGMEAWLPLADERVRLARRVDAGALFLTLLNRGTVHLYRGDVAGLKADYETADALVEEVRGWRVRYWPVLARGAIATLEGRLEEGRSLAVEGLEIGRAADLENIAQYYAQMMVLRFHQGTLRPNNLFAYEAENNADPLARATLARLFAADGDAESAAKHFDLVARHDFQDVPTNPVFVAEHWEFAWPTTMCMLADTCVFLRNERRARQLFELMSPYGGYHAVLGDYAAAYFGGLDLRLGMLTTLLGEYAAAEEYLDAAIGWAEASEARPWLAHALLASSRMYVARAREADLERACERARLALRLAREIGMARVERDALLVLPDPDSNSGLRQKSD